MGLTILPVCLLIRVISSTVFSSVEGEEGKERTCHEPPPQTSCRMDGDALRGEGGEVGSGLELWVGGASVRSFRPKRSDD